MCFVDENRSNDMTWDYDMGLTDHYIEENGSDIYQCFKESNRKNSTVMNGIP